MRRCKNIFCGFFLLISLFCWNLSFAGDTQDIKSEIYSKLKCCPCKDNFAQCTCPEAKEMKAYIDALLDTGSSQDDILFRIAKKFSLKVIIDKEAKAKVESRLIKNAGDKRAQLLLEPLVFDLGQARKSEGKIKKTVKISNKGNSELIITDIKTSCGCVTASIKSGSYKSKYFGTAGANPALNLKIAPEKTAELEFIIDLTHASVRVGSLIREVFISSNDPLYPKVSLMIKAEILE